MNLSELANQLAEIRTTQEQTAHHVYGSVQILLLPYVLFFFPIFLSTNTVGPSGPYKIIIIFYSLSRNLMFVVSWRKFARMDYVDAQHITLCAH
jgi:hypothetical protein